MAETAAEAPAETEKVDVSHLIDQLMGDIANAVFRVDLAVLGNGIYAVDDEGKLEGRAAAIVSDGLMVVIEEDKDEVEVAFIDLVAAYINTQY